MNRKYLTILRAIVLLAISGVVAGAAQAAATTIGFDAHAPGIHASLEPGPPLSPVSEEQAVRKAQEYLDIGGFSRQGLIKQLEFDNFSTEDATAAVDSLDVDWNEQAARKAKEYLDIGGFSHGGLVSQLEFDGFTSVQAEYGVTAVGL